MKGKLNPKEEYLTDIDGITCAAYEMSNLKPFDLDKLISEARERKIEKEAKVYVEKVTGLNISNTTNIQLAIYNTYIKVSTSNSNEYDDKFVIGFVDWLAKKEIVLIAEESEIEYSVGENLLKEYSNSLRPEFYLCEFEIENGIHVVKSIEL